VPVIQDEFDLVHIDGGHTLEIAESDIINTSKLLMNDAIIIMDDVNIYDNNHTLANLWLELSTRLGYKPPSFRTFENDCQDIKVKSGSQ
jgi:hypothetical protein